MDPSRFARHRFVRDKKKVAAIYPACLCGRIAAGPDDPGVFVSQSNRSFVLAAPGHQ